jgi:hypothetical protein
MATNDQIRPQPNSSFSGFALLVATMALLLSIGAILAVAFKLNDPGSGGTYAMHHGGGSVGSSSMMNGGGVNGSMMAPRARPKPESRRKNSASSSRATKSTRSAARKAPGTTPTCLRASPSPRGRR